MNKENWEEEYNTKLHDESDGASKHCYNGCDQYIELPCQYLKSFIHSLLKSQRAELIEEIEGMKVVPFRDALSHENRTIDIPEKVGYNQALEDVLTKLKNK